MPYYEYECPKCKETITVLAKMGDEPIKQCPFENCNYFSKKGFKKLMTSPNFKFVGAGFDYTSGKKIREKKQALKELRKRE